MNLRKIHRKKKKKQPEKNRKFTKCWNLLHKNEVADDQIWKELDGVVDRVNYIIPLMSQNVRNGNNTWSLVSRPLNKKVTKNKWVYRIKRNQDGNIEKFKARLVARGDQQLPGQHYDETFAPVARFEMLRALLAISAENEMFVHHMDIVSAYT
ncbi:uncharacterized protein LOC128877325 [Hylaeus volcanicus]|uniref:uncharacterized protein LOC128877325 n=1 Tax=Hylaeus volcanicus TaxID=313075 RepID=UPI0023B7FCC5|nr:uncharacterized protein LOC128877325 [Hylaeus volcanicus]